jgi:dynein heavy chain 1
MADSGLGVDDVDPGGGGPPSDVALMPVEKLVSYLCNVVPLLLEEDAVPGAQSQFGRLVNSPDGDQLLVPLTKFICDVHCKSMLVERFVGNKEEEEGEEGATAPDRGQRAQSSGPASHVSFPAYQIDLNVHYSNSRMASIVFVKKLSVVEAEKPIAQQIRVISLSDGSPYETLHSYVSSAVAPYFKSFVRESGKADRDGDKMATSMEKKIAELEMGLLHLQQNIDIPEISLTIHPNVQQIIKVGDET